MDIAASIGIAVVFLTVILPALLGMVLVGVIGRKRGGWWAGLAALILIVGYLVSPIPRVAVAAVYVTIPEARIPIHRLDLALSRLQRQAVIDMAERGELASAGAGLLTLPWWASGLSSDGTILIDRQACGRRVMFGTTSGFAFADPGCTDPFPEEPSGPAVHDIGGGWYWIGS